MKVLIDGKEFTLEETNIAKRSNTLGGIALEPVMGIFLDDETLFTTGIDEVLINGAPVRLFSDSYKWLDSQRYIRVLRKEVEDQIRKDRMKMIESDLPRISGTLQSVIDVISYLGKKEVAMSNGGYGDCQMIYTFVGIEVNKKNIFSLKIFKDEEVAKAKTQKAVELVYVKGTKRKKGLSPKAKQEYDTEVNTLLEGLNIDNLAERTGYLEELYNELKA